MPYAIHKIGFLHLLCFPFPSPAGFGIEYLEGAMCSYGTKGIRRDSHEYLSIGKSATPASFFFIINIRWVIYKHKS